MLLRESGLEDGCNQNLIPCRSVRLPFCLPSLATSWPKTDFPRSQWDGVPSAELGWSPALLAEVQEKSARLHLTAVMVIHHLTVVAQWGDTTQRDRQPLRQDSRLALAGARSVDTEENTR